MVSDNTGVGVLALWDEDFPLSGEVILENTGGLWARKYITYQQNTPIDTGVRRR